MMTNGDHEGQIILSHHVFAMKVEDESREHILLKLKTKKLLRTIRSKNLTAGV